MVVPELTDEELARQDAVEALIAIHMAHFDRLHYSAQVKRGLIRPGMPKSGDRDARTRFYGVDHIPDAEGTRVASAEHRQTAKRH